MLLVAVEPAHHTPPLAAIVIGSALVLAMLLAAALTARRAMKGRRAPKACPQCGAQAVRHTCWEQLTPRLTRVAIECGQCAGWRRVAVEHDVWHAHKRELERDRRRMARQAQRAEAVRSLAECRVFVALLRSEIVGAEDFLARTRPPATWPGVAS